MTKENIVPKAGKEKYMSLRTDIMLFQISMLALIVCAPLYGSGAELADLNSASAPERIHVAHNAHIKRHLDTQSASIRENLSVNGKALLNGQVVFSLQPIFLHHTMANGTDSGKIPVFDPSGALGVSPLIVDVDGGLIISMLTADRVVVTDADKKLVSSPTTAAELANLNGVTSPIQGQLNTLTFTKLDLAGGTMGGPLVLPDDSTTSPALRFSGATTTGLSATASNDTLHIFANGTAAADIASDSFRINVPFIQGHVNAIQAVQIESPSSNDIISVGSNIAVLLLTNGAAVNNVIVEFPAPAHDGQLFTIALATTFAADLINSATSPAVNILNDITQLDPSIALGATTGGRSITYFYNASDNTWYGFWRG